MSRAAQGSDVLLGFAIDEVIADSGACGGPVFVTEVIAASAAPTTVLGAGGNVTGTVIHYIVHVAKTGRTALGTGSTPLVCTADAVAVSVIPTPASSEVYARQVWRSDLVHTTPYLIGTIWDNVTTTFADDIAVDSASLDFNTTAPAYNQTGQNGGLVYMAEPESPTIDADYVQIKSKGLTGGAGEPASAPGDINIPVTFKHAMEAGLAVPVHGALLGAATTSTRNADGTNQYDWTPSLAKFNGSSLTMLRSEGRPVRPEVFPQVVFSEINGTVKGGALMEMAPKGMATHHTTAGIPIIASAPNAAYKFAPCLKGLRADSLYATAGTTARLYLKVTTAATGGYMTVKAKVGSGASYGSTTMLIPYDATTFKQTQSGSMTSDYFEVVDSTSGYPIGGDEGELRRPLMVRFPGDLTAIPLNAEYYFDSGASALIPGAGSTPGTADTWYTGFAPRQLAGPRFTSSHATLYWGDGALSTPSTYLPSEDFKWKIMSGLKLVKPDGKEAAHGTDADRTGYLGFQIDVESRYVSRRWKNAQERNLRVSAKLLIEGERPFVQPGTRSVNRLTYQVLSLQMRVDKTAVPISGPNTLMNPTSFVAEQYPGQELFTVRIIDGTNRWYFRT